MAINIRDLRSASSRSGSVVVAKSLTEALAKKTANGLFMPQPQRPRAS
jgi:hypothetical protein